MESSILYIGWVKSTHIKGIHKEGGEHGKVGREGIPTEYVGII